MSSVICEVNLSPHDTYVLARALVGLEWHDLPCSPLTRLILSHVDLSSPDDLAALRRLLGPEGLRAVLRVDPETPCRRTAARGREMSTWCPTCRSRPA